MQLFELCGRDPNHRFSPFVWRIRLALLHKGISCERIPVPFLDKSAIEPSGSKTVPVIRDGDTWVADSWRIACYLEDQYSDKAPLFTDEVGRSAAHFINCWADQSQLRTMFMIVAPDIPKNLDDATKEYFIETRSARLGFPLAQLEDQRDANLRRLGGVLAPLEAHLGEFSFVCGDAPAYGDYIVFGGFQWVRQASRLELVEPGSAIAEWRERMLDLFDGEARAAPGPNYTE